MPKQSSHSRRLASTSFTTTPTCSMRLIFMSLPRSLYRPANRGGRAVNGCPAAASGVGGGRSRRLDVERGDAPQLAPVLQVLERRGPVHGAAIVPDDQVADPPGVPVDEPRLGR